MTSILPSLDDLRTTVTAPTASTQRDQTARWIFRCLAIVLLPIMVAASFDFGVTWDEKARHRNGERILEYLTGELDRAFFDQDPDAGLYAGLFDVVCAAIERVVPANRYVIRHVINACFGWIGVLFCGMLAAHLFGRWTGVLAMILLAATPRYFADSMNNPKDLPFAAMTIGALYCISRTAPHWPYLSAADTVRVVLALGLALNVRPAALLFLGYLGLLVGWYALVERPGARRLAATIAHLAVITISILILGTAFWPWAQGAPLTRPIEGLFGFSGYPYRGSVLFNGVSYPATQLPRYYVPEFWLISTPPVVIVGVALSSIHLFRRRLALRTAALWLAATVPAVLIVVMHSTLYDGLRHLLFTYPIVVVVAAAGWAAALSPPAPRWETRLAGGLLAAGIASALYFDVRFHPHQTVYFNQLVGGPRGAFGRFDLDYWGNCLLQGVEWTSKTATAMNRQIVISGHPWHVVELDAERFQGLAFVRPERRREQVTVFLGRGKDFYDRVANSEKALHRVRAADGTVLCVVMPGPRFSEIQPLFPPHEVD